MENTGIGTWIDRRRVKSADTVAVIDGEVRRTYAEFADRIDRLASVLADRGITPRDRVAFLGHNCVEFLETLFAVGTLGAIFVPINARLAPAEIAYVLADSGSSLLIHGEEFAVSLEQFTVARLPLGNSYESAIAAAVPVCRDVPVTLDDTAAILYTSGTTGKPKGAMLSHGNFTWNVMNVLVDYDVTSRDIALMVSPLFHVASLGMGALPTLIKGGTLVLQTKFDPASVLEAIEHHRITSLSGVPTTFQLLAEHPRWESTDLSSLEKLTCGGSPVPARVAAAYEKRGLAFSSGYGMTETSPGATSLSPQHSSTKSTTSGLPHFFTDVRIVDANGTEAPAGTQGEILISGPNVMTGYWGLPRESAEVLADGWLRSGDIGFRDAEGFVTIADRAKDMIISGGENIYPAEVEQLIMELPEVESVAVIGVVVPMAGSTVSHELLSAHLEGRVARYKIPKSTVIVAELPRTASGKVRKQELRDRFGAS
jgi:fatty-acyl-CoA synthase